jgi:hypothetical protein
MLPPASSGEQSLAYYGNGGKESLGPFYPNKPPQDKKDAAQQGPRTRKEWLKEWETNNPGRVLPCSAKAVYRLADSELLVFTLGDMRVHRYCRAGFEGTKESSISGEPQRERTDAVL